MMVVSHVAESVPTPRGFWKEPVLRWSKSVNQAEKFSDNPPVLTRLNASRKPV
jgi:hypothetical protein